MTASLRMARWPMALVALGLVLVIGLGAIAPAFAETAGQRSTRNILLGAAALAVGIILYNNYHHKQVAHNTVVGYTRDGGTVYADGRVVYPDGRVYYTSNNGRSLCNYDGDEESCGQYARAYPVAREDESQPAYAPAGYYAHRPAYHRYTVPRYRYQADTDDRYRSSAYSRERIDRARHANGNRREHGHHGGDGGGD